MQVALGHLVANLPGQVYQGDFQMHMATAIQLPGLQTHLGTATALVIMVPLQVEGMQIKGLAPIAGNWDITTWIAPGTNKVVLRIEHKIGGGMTHLCLLQQVRYVTSLITMLDSSWVGKMKITSSVGF